MQGLIFFIFTIHPSNAAANFEAGGGLQQNCPTFLQGLEGKFYQLENRNKTYFLGPENMLILFIKFNYDDRMNVLQSKVVTRHMS